MDFEGWMQLPAAPAKDVPKIEVKERKPTRQLNKTKFQSKGRHERQKRNQANKTNVSRTKLKFVTNLTKDNQGGLARNVRKRMEGRMRV